MDVMIQQDGRIATNFIISPNLRGYFETAEACGWSAMDGMMKGDNIPKPPPIIRRTFRRLGAEGNVTVWVEVR